MSPKAKMCSRLVPFLAIAVFVHGWSTALPVVGQRDLWMWGLCASWRTLVNNLWQADQISIFVNSGDAIILCLKLLLAPNQIRRNREHWRRQKVLSIIKYEILLETMTVTEIISIAASKLMCRFLLQIQQQLQKHEDGRCSPLVLYIVHIFFRHKLCQVRHCRCVHCNRVC